MCKSQGRSALHNPMTLKRTSACHCYDICLLCHAKDAASCLGFDSEPFSYGTPSP